MVKFVITESYTLKLTNKMDVALPYDITDIDPAIPAGTIPANTKLEFILSIRNKPVVDPCVKLLILPYSYGRPVFVEFSYDQDDPFARSLQDIDLTEMPGFTMVENDTTVDHIMEFGYHVKLYGGSTANICIDVWCDETAAPHTKL
jgi:hypothetical protein